jgi:hypothetical protein
MNIHFLLEVLCLLTDLIKKQKQKQKLLTSKFRLFSFIIKMCHWQTHPHLPLFICLSGRGEEVAARGDKEKNKPGCLLQATHWPLSRRDTWANTSCNCLQSAGVGWGWPSPGAHVDGWEPHGQDVHGQEGAALPGAASSAPPSFTASCPLRSYSSSGPWAGSVLEIGFGKTWEVHEAMLGFEYCGILG